MAKNIRDNKGQYIKGCIPWNKCMKKAISIEEKRIKAREYSRKYRLNNPDKVKEATKKWRLKNKKRVAKNIRNWKLNNKDKVELSRCKFHIKNPNYKREYSRKWFTSLYGRYTIFKTTAKRKKRKLEITFEDWKKIIKKPCYYCGDKLKSKYGYCIDRLDNKKGYTLDNSVPCCNLCNQMKSNLNKKEFINHIKKILEEIK